MMARPERTFALGTLLATLVVPGAFLALEPFREPRAALGVVAGWGLALLIIVPSFWLMARVMGSDDRLAFHRAFMGGSMGRFALGIAGVVLFATQIDQPPLWSFISCFFLGYFALSALEVHLLLKKAPTGTHA
jgi:hypothetical protein